MSLLKNLFKIELNPNRIFGLDLLRAMAILFVVAEHGRNLMPKARYKYVDYFILDGVNIFFVLSGFLIGGILIRLLKQHTLNHKLLLNFWLRRWFRTLPNYFLILATVLLLNIIFTDNFSAASYTKYFFFAQNLFSEQPTFFCEAWSLSVEEWFYVTTPIILFLLIRVFNISVNQSILITALIIIISVTSYRYYIYSSGEIDSIHVWYYEIRRVVFTRLDNLMYGVVGAFLMMHYKNFWKTYKTPFLILGVLLLYAGHWNLFNFQELGLIHCVFSISISGIATLLVLPFFSELNARKHLGTTVISYISLISYSMYLINLTLMQYWILDNINLSFLQGNNSYTFLIVRYLLYWGLTFIISILLYKYFETPVMNLRDRIKIK